MVSTSRVPFYRKGENLLTRPMIFISYSHKDEAEKDKLLSHLGVLAMAELVDAWTDDCIGPGVDWENEIEIAIRKSRIAILLISANFLTSEFILKKEIPQILASQQEQKTVIYPIIARACAWQKVNWLAKINVRPKNGRPIWRSANQQIDEELTLIAEEIAEIVKYKPWISLSEVD